MEYHIVSRQAPGVYSRRVIYIVELPVGVEPPSHMRLSLIKKLGGKRLAFWEGWDGSDSPTSKSEYAVALRRAKKLIEDLKSGSKCPDWDV